MGNLADRLSNLYAQTDARFDVLARSARLDPQNDFRFRDLRALRFSEADLRGFDFSGSDLAGTGLRLARHIDSTTALAGALLDEADAAWHGQRFQQAAEDIQTLTVDLRRALDRRQFLLVYQPKMTLRGNTIIGAEALLRWDHPDRGLVLPATFVPLLEEAGLIEAVTYWTIETAIEHQRLLAGRGVDLMISLNISAQLITTREFVRNCARLIEGQTAKLRFEVSETDFILDMEATLPRVRELAELGISLAIDDYGVGLSSLAFLKQIPAQELKIDKSFINRITNETSDPLIVRSTIDLAHALDMTITADGVETAAQLSLLTVMGCDAAQGFLISRPLAIKDFEIFSRKPIEWPSSASTGVNAIRAP